MELTLSRVCIFCGASAGTDPVYAEVARDLARTLVRHRIAVVTGGGKVGLMGAVADAALAAGGEAIGVIPLGLVERELAHTGMTDLHVVGTLHERKARMAELSDAFVALPGGLGTLEELAEVLSWAQLALHTKPVALLNVRGYFDPLLRFLDQAVKQGFVLPEHRAMLLVATEPEALIEALATYAAPADRWGQRTG